LFVLVGVCLGFWAHSIDDCAWKGGACDGRASLLAGVSFGLIAFFGALPLVNRWIWVAMKYQQYEYFLRKWQDRFDGPFGEVWEWLLGLDRDGYLKP
jgi:hypothetical protein